MTQLDKQYHINLCNIAPDVRHEITTLTWTQYIDLQHRGENLIDTHGCCDTETTHLFSRHVNAVILHLYLHLNFL